ncbi:MAG: hypothetical protein ABL866_08575 [Devosia sp.]|jgi:hypothetical protein
MAAAFEIARVRREIETLVETTSLDLRPGAKSPLTPAEKRHLRSEIQICIQSLDELATRLSP